MTRTDSMKIQKDDFSLIALWNNLLCVLYKLFIFIGFFLMTY